MGHVQEMAMENRIIPIGEIDFFDLVCVLLFVTHKAGF